MGVQPEGEVARKAKFFQLTQLILNPIRERKWRPDVKHVVIVVQNERKKSRSHEIDVSSFCEDPSSWERTVRPVVFTSVIQAHSSEDRKDWTNEATHCHAWRD